MSVEKAIWSAYLANPCRLFSIRELSLHLGKSYPLIHQHMTRLVKEHKLSSRVVGKSILCYPNFNNMSALLSLAAAQELHTQKIILKNSSSFAIHQFFSSHVSLGLLSVWSTKNKLVLCVADESFKKSLKVLLSKTTLSIPVVILSLSEITKDVSYLLEKEVVFFGYENFNILIRANYALFSSNYNLVNLNE